MGIERYSTGGPSSGAVNSGSAYAELLAGAADPISVRSITVTTNSNIGGTVALCRAAFVGTGTTVYTGVCHRSIATQPTGPSGRLNTAWSSAPTGSTMKLKEEVLPVGTGQTKTLWDVAIDGPLVIERLNSVLFLNGASGIDGGGIRVNVTWEEGRR